uniref:FZ domain-containing protein n=1 Tax=Caenorhabditis japonica TaxID=281687 RepID=A0A8R1E5Q8_CAEJA
MLFLFVILAFSVTNAYLEDSWAMFSSERPLGPKCVEIPSNLSICTGIEYTQMRLPNYLEHETVSEAVHASKDWESLLRLNCHPDTQRFLCSLFAPVCLMQMDRAILPCKSLCMAVKQGCENRMANYGFPWPEMLSCEKFVDDDMCIKPVQPAKETSGGSPPCSACSQVATYENLVDQFCRSHLEIRLSAESTGCPCNISTKVKNEKFVVMASRQSDGNYLANLVLPWKKDKNFKRAVHQFQRLNCQSLGREIRESASKRPHYYEMRRHNTGRYQLF